MAKYPNNLCAVYPGEVCSGWRMAHKQAGEEGRLGASQELVQNPELALASMPAVSVISGKRCVGQS